MVKASASVAEDPGFESRLRRDFSGSSHTSDFKIVTSVATLPGAWRCRVSADTGRPGVNIHRFNGSANKINLKKNAISALSNLVAELSLRTKWHVT